LFQENKNFVHHKFHGPRSSNTTGIRNTATGAFALNSNTTGFSKHPAAIVRSLTTQPPTATSHRVFRPASISPRAVTTSISAMLGPLDGRDAANWRFEVFQGGLLAKIS